MTTLVAYDLLGKRIGGVQTDCWHAWTSLVDILADRFSAEVDAVEIDTREDGVSYITVDGQIRGYVMDATSGKEIGVRPWEADRSHANDNEPFDAALLAAVAEALQAAE